MEFNIIFGSLSAVEVLVVPVQIEELVAPLHGTAGVQVVRQLPQNLCRLQALDIKVRQGFLSQPRPQNGAGDGAHGGAAAGVVHRRDHGAVKVGGIDVRNYNLEVLRDQVSVVLQKNVLFSGSIYENIRWGDEHASDEEVRRVCRLAQADGFISEFPSGYNTMIVQGGNNVSGGQKQRLCIARALLKKPKILILDDSTSAVDTRTDALIRKAFREEIPDTTKIIIAQRVSSIEDADQIIVLDGGRISGVGTSEELLKTNDIYREVYESQVKGGEEDE